MCHMRELTKLEQSINRGKPFARMCAIQESYGKLTEEGVMYEMKDFDTIAVLECFLGENMNN